MITALCIRQPSSMACNEYNVYVLVHLVTEWLRIRANNHANVPVLLTVQYGATRLSAMPADGAMTILSCPQTPLCGGLCRPDSVRC